MLSVVDLLLLAYLAGILTVLWILSPKRRE
jgi:hypothetical protein